MRNIVRGLLGSVSLGLLAAPVAAQEISGVFDLPTLAHGQVMSAMGGTGGSPSDADADTAGRPAAAGVPRGFPYPAPSEQFREAQVARLVERTAARDRRTAEIIRDQFARHDYAAIYDGIVRPYGLAGNDTANALAAYMLLGWMIVNGGREPTPEGVRGVRAQSQRTLAARRVGDPNQRAASGEELKLRFVVLHAGWQAARREGTLARYADDVARTFAAAAGFDMRRATIGANGLSVGR